MQTTRRQGVGGLIPVEMKGQNRPGNNGMIEGDGEGAKGLSAA